MAKQTETRSGKQVWPSVKLSTTSDIGRSEVGDSSIGQHFTERLIGPSNTGDIIFHSVPTKALIDSGSMVTTVSHSFHEGISDKPPLQDIKTLGLDISVADGSSLSVTGFIESFISVPCLSNAVISVPVLVIPDTEFNSSCPVIIGTNVIRHCKSHVLNGDASDVPEAWSTAFSALSCNSSIVRVTNKHTIAIGPYESMTFYGITRSFSHSASAFVTENLGDSNNNFLVKPHVDKLPDTGNCARVPVHICNVTAKTIFVPPRSVICHNSEVNVIDNLASYLQSETKVSETHDEGDITDKLGVVIDNYYLTSAQLQNLKGILGKWEHVFSKGATDIGCTDLVKHRIVLNDDTPFKEPYRKIPPAMYEEVRQHLREMLNCGAIRESDSPFSSNVVLVRKKYNSLRFCLDHRKLNSRTRKDAYMLPRFDDTVDVLAGSRFFSKLDLRSSYWQVEIEEQDKQKTAFSVGNLGFYECNRMSFGLCNAPATLQRLMEKCMGELLLKECLIFIDDILIFSPTFEEHMQRLESVFSRLAAHNLKLKPSKCEFCKSSVTYLGHIISVNGIEADPTKTEVIKNWPTPSNVQDVRSFLGFAGYYRRFVRDFSKIAKTSQLPLARSIFKQESKEKQEEEAGYSLDLGR